MIREKIATGSYNSASEVVREALRLLEQEDQLRSLKMQKLRSSAKIYRKAWKADRPQCSTRKK